MLRSTAFRITVCCLLVLAIMLGTGGTISPAAGGLQAGRTAATPSESSDLEVAEIEETWTLQDGATTPVSVFYPVTGDAGASFPMIVFIHPWDCDKSFFDRKAEEYASYGYVTATYTVRGWYGAEGQMGCMDPACEMRDLSEIITLASGDGRFPVLRDGKGPVVGVTGYSMGGCISFLAAPRRNPRDGDPGDQRIRAVVPMHGGADLLYSIFPNGAAKAFWGLFLVLGAYMGNLSGITTNLFNTVMREDMGAAQKLSALVAILGSLANPVTDVAPGLLRMLAGGIQRNGEDLKYAEEFLRLRSARYWCDGEYDGDVEHPVTAPMLIIAGWNDDIFYANEGLRIFSTCMDAPARMIITNHGHLGGMGSNFFIDLGNNPEYDWVDTQVREWFDHYLRGEDNGVEKEPRLVFYRDRDPASYGASGTFPLPGTCRTSYYLDAGRGGGRLSTRRPRGSATQPDLLINIGVTGSVSLPYYQDVTQLLGGASMDIPLKLELFEVPFTEKSYLSDVLTRDVTMMGAPMLELYYQSSQPVMQIIPRLYEVTPGGREIAVSRGWYEGSNAVSWSMSSTAGKPVEMQANYHRFPAGSRIKLELSTADLLMAWPYWGLNFILLHHRADAASRLVLPLVPNTY